MSLESPFFGDSLSRALSPLICRMKKTAFGSYPLSRRERGRGEGFLISGKVKK
jgi:hypothetical protein